MGAEAMAAIYRVVVVNSFHLRKTTSLRYGFQKVYNIDGK